AGVGVQHREDDERRVAVVDGRGRRRGGGAQPGRGEDHGAAVDVLDDRVGEGLGDQVVGVVVQVRAGEGQVAQAVPEPVGELLVEQQFGEDGRGGGDRGDALRADNVSELVDHVGEVVV